MGTEVLLVEKANGIAILTLNRPQSMNALSSELRSAIRRAFAALEKDDSIRAVVLTGAGERAFCAGLDLKELAEQRGLMASVVGNDTPDNMADALAQCRKPIIAAVNGVAATGGLELVLCCDAILASSNARFVDTHAQIEAIPAWGLSQRLARLIGVMRAKEMSLACTAIDAATAYSWGLVNHVFEPEALLTRACEMAGKMADIRPTMLKRYKALIEDGAGLPLSAALSLERRTAQNFAHEFEPAAVADKWANISRAKRQP